MGLDEPSVSEVDIPLHQAQCLVIDLMLVPKLDERLALDLQCLTNEMVEMRGGKLRRIRLGSELIAIL